MCGRSGVGVQIPDRSNLTQRLRSYKRLATSSTSTQVALLPWRYDAEMGTATRYTLQRNTASILRVWFYFAQRTERKIE